MLIPFRCKNTKDIIRFRNCKNICYFSFYGLWCHSRHISIIILKFCNISISFFFLIFCRIQIDCICSHINIYTSIHDHHLVNNLCWLLYIDWNCNKFAVGMILHINASRRYFLIINERDDFFFITFIGCFIIQNTFIGK